MATVNINETFKKNINFFDEINSISKNLTKSKYNKTINELRVKIFKDTQALMNNELEGIVKSISNNSKDLKKLSEKVEKEKTDNKEIKTLILHLNSINKNNITILQNKISNKK